MCFACTAFKLSFSFGCPWWWWHWWSRASGWPSTSLPCTVAASRRCRLLASIWINHNIREYAWQELSSYCEDNCSIFTVKKWSSCHTKVCTYHWSTGNMGLGFWAAQHSTHSAQMYGNLNDEHTFSVKTDAGIVVCHLLRKIPCSLFLCWSGTIMCQVTDSRRSLISRAFDYPFCYEYHYGWLAQPPK